MKEFNCKWLPNIIELTDYNGNWDEYYSALYDIFLNDFITTKPKFKNKIVQTRKEPRFNQYEHGFIHLTTVSNPDPKDMNDRLPDIRRCERISWNRKLIENHLCNEKVCVCKKIYYYEQKWKNTYRIHLVFPNARYKVILEKRPNYYLLITGYYMEYDYKIKKEIKKTEEFKEQKTPID